MKQNGQLLSRSALNMLGTVFYFACQWLTTLVVLYFAGFEDVGVYSLAVSFTNIFGFVARYGVRQFQVSDIQGEHSDAEYIAVRGITSLAAVGLFVGSLLYYQFSPAVMACNLIILVFKLLESVTDVVFGIFQEMDVYKKLALSYMLKGLLPILAFGGLLYCKTSLATACLGMTVAYGLIILVYDLPSLKRKNGFPGRCTSRGVWRILKVCFPLMLFTLLNPYMTFITRYVIENRFSSELLGYYSSISMVIVVLSTLAGSVWTVASPWAASHYQEKRYKEILQFCGKVLLALVAITILALLAGSYLGDFALALVFGRAILPYSYLLNPMLVVSVLLTMVAFENTLLIAFRKQKALLLLNAAGAVACVASVYPLVERFDMLGSSYSLMLGIGLQALLLGGYLIKLLKKMFDSTVFQWW